LHYFFYLAVLKRWVCLLAFLYFHQYSCNFCIFIFLFYFLFFLCFLFQSSIFSFF
jgi:hypothetical protein